MNWHFSKKDIQMTNSYMKRCSISLILEKCKLKLQWGIISSVVHSVTHVWLFETPWTAALQASLSITNSQSLLKLMSIELVIPPNHLILCRPFSSCLQSFPASWSFLMTQFFASGGQRLGASASASVLPVNIQDWFPLGLTGFILLLSKGLSRVWLILMLEKREETMTIS